MFLRCLSSARKTSVSVPYEFSQAVMYREAETTRQTGVKRGRWGINDALLL